MMKKFKQHQVGVAISSTFCFGWALGLYLTQFSTTSVIFGLIAVLVAGAPYVLQPKLYTSFEAKNVPWYVKSVGFSFLIWLFLAFGIATMRGELSSAFTPQALFQLLASFTVVELIFFVALGIVADLANRLESVKS